jgi:hypothetical protein
MKYGYFFILFVMHSVLFGQTVAPTEIPADKIPHFLKTSYISMLKSRIYLKCPPEARNEPRPYNLVHVTPSEEQETRITIDTGDKRLVLFAQEMNALAGKNLRTDVESMYTSAERSDYRFQELKTADGMRAVMTTPTRYDTTKDAILINSLIVQMKDSSLVQIGAYVNPKAFIVLKSYLSLTDSILHTAIAGPRKIDFQYRKSVLDLPGSLTKLLIELPDHFLLISSKGDDFIDYQIRKIQSVTIPVSGGIIIYSGFHPASLALEYKFNPEDVKEKEELFLGKKIKWACYADETKKMYLKELTCDAGTPGKGLKIHIAIVASSEKELENLSHIARKMLLKK